jgi:hypothetical protein
MKRCKTLILVLLAPILVVFAAGQPASAAGVGALSGSVFFDANGDGMAEPGEARVPGAHVYVRAQDNPALIFEATANAEGLFVVEHLPNGVYDMWACAEGKVARHTTEVAVDEVGAPVLVDLPLYNRSVNETGKNPKLYLPLLVQ